MTEIPLTVEVDALADPHTHLREGDVVGPLIEKAIEGGIDVLGPMPNTSAGLKTAEEVLMYTEVAEGLVPKGKIVHFIPIVMLTEKTTREELVRCKEAGIRNGKIYPLFRTTKSGSGVRRYGLILQVVRWCGELEIKVHGHFEHPSLLFYNRDAEFACLPIVRMFLEETKATIIWEHGTDGRCISHWEDMATSNKFFVTITAHHLATNEDKTFGDVRAVCKPPIKTEDDRKAIIQLVGENYEWVMNGPDVAAHDESAKHKLMEVCACGAYTAPFLLPLYAHALDHLLKTPKGIETFINFTSRNVRKLHELPPASRQIKLVRRSFRVPLVYTIGSWKVMPFWAGQEIDWSITE